MPDWHLFGHNPGAKDYTQRFDGDRRFFELKAAYNDELLAQYVTRLESDIGTSVNQDGLSQATGRAPDQARQSSTSLICSAT